MTRPAFILALAAALTTPLALGDGNAGLPKSWCEEPTDFSHHHYLGPAAGLLVLLSQDGNVEDCDRNGIPYDFDGHYDWAYGGAWLAVPTEHGWNTGSLVCWGEIGHHPNGGPIAVQDAILGATVPFEVSADLVNLVPPTDPSHPNCGDFETDQSIRCVGFCVVPFSAGLDGMYFVHVGDATLAPSAAGSVDS